MASPETGDSHEVSFEPIGVEGTAFWVLWTLNMQAATQKRRELKASLTAEFSSQVSVERVGESPRSGERLRQIRIRLGMTTRDVAAYSQRISSEEEENEDYCISNAWLTQVENTGSVPGIHKLFSLSVIYRQSFSDLLRLFGVDLTKIGNHQLSFPLPNTYPTTFGPASENRPVSFPVHFDQGSSLNCTNLLSRIVGLWGEMPIALISILDLKHSTYGFIGLKDFMMYPFLRPGTFVQIDGRSTKVQKKGVWRTQFDRPIYFVEERDGYACAWCELEGRELRLIPHPCSPCATRFLRFPDEAEIVGRVTGIAMQVSSPVQEAQVRVAGTSESANS
jgi:transcriptional regulator with XRE-family HTH domain